MKITKSDNTPKKKDTEMLQLSDVEVGRLANPPRYDEKEMKFVKSTDGQTRQNFIKLFNDKKYDYKAKHYSQSMFYLHDNIPEEAQAYHRNYVGYLQRCWKDHLGIVITPDILWYTVLSELVLIVQANVENHRHLFSTNKDKQDIIVLTGDPEVMPLSLLAEALKKRVPTDSKLFLPEFSTTTARSRHSFRAVFCDMCSPYYNYSMMSCGFPAIDVQGEAADYEKVHENYVKLVKLFPTEREYMSKVAKQLKEIITKRNNSAFWKGIFNLERCGSGGQVLLSGWWTNLYKETPKVRYPENYSAHIAKVPYKNLDSNREFEMQDGLFFSRMNGDFLEPNFGFIVHEKKKPVITESKDRRVITGKIKKLLDGKL